MVKLKSFKFSHMFHVFATDIVISFKKGETGLTASGVAQLVQTDNMAQDQRERCTIMLAGPSGPTLSTNCLESYQ